MKITAIHHHSVLISNLDKALEFYTQILGLKQDETRPDLGYPGAWLKVGQSQIHLLLLPSPDPRDQRPEHVGRDRHVALSVQGVAQLTQRLDKEQIPYTKSRSGRQAIFFRDPDGNGIECIEYT